MKARGGKRDALLVIFAVTGGAWAWTLQLWLSWIVGEPLCSVELGGWALGASAGGALWLGIGLAAGALAAAALLASYLLWRGSQGESLAEEVGRDGPRRFLAYVGLVLNGLLLLTIVMGTTAPLWLAACI